MTTFRRDPLPKQENRAAEALRQTLGHLFDHGRSSHDSDTKMSKSAAGEFSFTIASGATAVVYHGLGHQPSGWRLADLRASAAITHPIRRTDWNSETITLANDSGVTVTVKVEVF